MTLACIKIYQNQIYVAREIIKNNEIRIKDNNDELHTSSIRIMIPTRSCTSKSIKETSGRG